MKRKLLLGLALLFFIGMFTSRAQDTFEDKKHPRNTTAKSASQPKFNVRGISREKSQNTSKSARAASLANKASSTGSRNFRMPSVFDRRDSTSLYEHKVLQSSEVGIPLFVRSKAREGVAKSARSSSLETVGKEYLEDLKGLLRVDDPSSEFTTLSKKEDALGQTHLKMQQVFKGVKVYGSEVVVHFDGKQQVQALNGRNRPTPRLEIIAPALSLTDALTVVESDLGTKLPKVSAVGAKTSRPGAASVLSLPEPEDELLIYPVGDSDILVRHLTVFPNLMDRWEYFIDAKTGKVVDKYKHTCSFNAVIDEMGVGRHAHDDHATGSEFAGSPSVLSPGASFSSPAPPENGNGNDLNGVNRSLNTFSIDGTNYMVNASKPMFNSGQSEMPDNPIGGIMTLDLRNEPPAEGVSIFHVTSNSNNWNDPIAVSAHYNADVSYEYFRNTFDRNAINGEGGTIVSFINVGDPNDGGSLENAFWNGKAMFYGNGRTAFRPFAGGLDVGGHEMSHGVIQNTANLEYRYQSGAINESFADIFGVMIDRDDWQLGEDIVNISAYPSGAMRDMSDPNNGGIGLSDAGSGWQPKDMNEYYTGDQDNGGVHINSGIPNRAFFLVATDLGKDSAEQIYYRALDTYLTVSSQFIDLRLAVIQSAIDIHGENSPEVQSIENAFDTVGILGGTSTDTDNDIPVAEGDEFIISYDVNPDDANTLYLSNTQGNDFSPLTTTALFRKPSVADDGSLAIYVTADNTINAVNLNPDNPDETVISPEPVWAAVALSKDATKFAAVRNDESNIIFILDLVNGGFQEFELYNPTSADGLTTGEVLYPDALEWDYSGQYLIYDALNRLGTENGQDIEYWDVGAMKVWDNQTGTYGDGSIQKLFADLPAGVSIGNPSFSKTSGNILAFDYFDELNDEYEVITANIETGEVKTVYQNNKLGFPNYSRNDDQLIFDSNNNGSEVIGVIGIGGDKISPSGTASELIPDGKWGIWYTVGDRSTLSDEKAITDFRFNVTSPASVGVISGNQITVSLPDNINAANLIATFTESARSVVSVGGEPQQSSVTVNDFTNPVTYTVTAEDGSSQEYTVRLGAGGGGGGPGPFSLPADNFRVLAKGESCVDSNNGSIQIEAAQNLDYTVTLSGNGQNASESFSDEVSFFSLEGGSYSVCITVAGQAGYENCFDVVVAEAEALGVVAKTDTSSKTVTLKLSGGEKYTIALDDEVLTTTASEVTLPLNSSAVKLTVKTDKDCQGTYEEDIDLAGKVIVYPNPVRSGLITVALEKAYDRPIAVQLNTLDGRMVMQNSIEPNTDKVTLDADGLTTGAYLLQVTADGNTKTFKIVKQ